MSRRSKVDEAGRTDAANGWRARYGLQRERQLALGALESGATLASASIKHELRTRWSWQLVA